MWGRGGNYDLGGLRELPILWRGPGGVGESGGSTKAQKEEGVQPSQEARSLEERTLRK